MIIYLILLIGIAMIFTLSKNKKNAFIISFILITLTAALRKYTVGADTQQFYTAFLNIVKDSSWNYNNFRYEPGFYYLCKLLGMISNDAQILIIVTSVFINYSIFKFIKKNSSDLFLSTILYIITLSFFSNMNIMRQAIALAILLYAFEFIKEKKYIRYILMVLVASLFHTVAFASMLLMFFAILPCKKITYYIEILAAIISFILYRQLFSLLTLRFDYGGYATNEFGVSNYFGAVLCAFEVLVAVGSLLLISYSKKDKDYNNKMKLLTIASILYIWFEFLVIRMNIFNRVAGLFSVYNIVLIPCLLDKIKKRNENNYIIMKNFVILIYLTSFLVISTLRPEWHGVIPYYFFWQ